MARAWMNLRNASGQPLQALELHGVGKLLPASGQARGDSQGRPSGGIPTLADRVAQMVVKQYAGLDRMFDPDPYGYRPGNQRIWRLSKRASDAGTMTRLWTLTSKAFSARSTVPF